MDWREIKPAEAHIKTGAIYLTEDNKPRSLSDEDLQYIGTSDVFLLDKVRGPLAGKNSFNNTKIKSMSIYLSDYRIVALKENIKSNITTKIEWALFDVLDGRCAWFDARLTKENLRSYSSGVEKQFFKEYFGISTEETKHKKPKPRVISKIGILDTSLADKIKEGSSIITPEKYFTEFAE